MDRQAGSQLVQGTEPASEERQPRPDAALAADAEHHAEGLRRAGFE
jgi:hypothetical protein